MKNKKTNHKYKMNRLTNKHRIYGSKKTYKAGAKKEKKPLTEEQLRKKQEALEMREKQDNALKIGVERGIDILSENEDIDNAIENGKEIAIEMGANQGTLKRIEEHIRLYMKQSKLPIEQEIYYLIGPPAIGKSTYIDTIIDSSFPDKSVLLGPKKQNENEYVNQYDIPPLLVINRDNIVDRIGEIQEPKLSYNDMFLESNKDKQAIVNTLLQNEKKKISLLDKDGLPIYKVVIIDMTNMYQRARILPTNNNSKIQKKYKIKKIAIKFNWDIPNTKEVLYQLMDLRDKFIKEQDPSKNKTIPREAINRMVDTYQEINEVDEFDEIRYIDTMPEMLQLLQ